MTTILFLLAVLAVPVQADDTIRFPQPPAPIEGETAPKEVNTISGEEWYVIQSTQPILVICSPVSAVSVEYIPGTIMMRGKFVDGSGVETRKIEGEHNYILSANQQGTAEIIVIPTLDQGALIRRTLKLIPSQEDPRPKDEVSEVFDLYEQEWRYNQKQLADRLLRGDLATENDAAEWMSFALSESRKKVFRPLLVKESAVFGGDQWTAKKHADYIMRYIDVK